VNFKRIKYAPPAVVDIEDRHVEDKQGIVHSATAEDFAPFVYSSGRLFQPPK
jgi:hypothetical protein